LEVVRYRSEGKVTKALHMRRISIRSEIRAAGLISQRIAKYLDDFEVCY
jgi:hypothetical protein